MSDPSKHKAWKSDAGTPTRLFMLRHGEVDQSKITQLYGQLDVGLSPRGERQSAAAGEALRDVPLHAVYTSDLVRADTLARCVASHHNLSPVQDIRLRERRFGDWQGREWSDIELNSADQLKQYHADRFRYRVPGDSENFEDVRDRVVELLEEIVPRHPGQNVAITAHSGTVRIALADCLGLPLDCIFTFELGFCSISAVNFYPSGLVRVQKINDTHHLKEIE